HMEVRCKLKKSINMKKTLVLLIFAILILTSTFKLFAQEITEENYQKLDKEIWDFQEREYMKISNIFELHPEKKDSLINAAEKIKNICDRKNIELAKKFASVPSGLQRVFWLRLNIPKDTLKSILTKLPINMQESAYAKSIELHIDSQQITEGYKIFDFQSVDHLGNPFKLSNLNGKITLLLYGGLGCIGEDGRDFLKKYYNSANSDKFKIVVFDNESSNVEELKNKREQYGLDFIMVSDFK